MIGKDKPEKTCAGNTLYPARIQQIQALRPKQQVTHIRSSVWLMVGYPRHVWSYDFVSDRTHDGRAYRTLNIIDEYTRECLAIRVGRSLKTEGVQSYLTELFCTRGVPVHIRSDNGSEFANRAMRTWLAELGVKTLFIEPGSPWENGYIESFNGKLRDELLNSEIFYTLEGAKIILEQWRIQYNTVRPHSSIGHRPPAPQAVAPPVPIPPLISASTSITTLQLDQ
ncbi:MAG: IS3 family transposase [Anaerolineaceae bacterium]|nr:IS3 family transposase [Anaerolineaceae bacterium]